MTVYTFINQKGGVGKSTATVNCAAVTADVINDPASTSQEEDSPVLAVSTDPQGSAVWWADRVDDLPFRITQVDGNPELLRSLGDLPGVEHVFVDTPGWLGDDPGTTENGNTGLVLDALLSATDLAVVPLTPEVLAFDPTARTIEKVLKPRGVAFKVVINNWDPRDGRADLEETQQFARSMGWPLANTVIRRYKLHTRAAADGKVVTEYPTNRVALQAREDFQRLCLELNVGAR